MIGDCTSLSITHTGSTFLNSPSHPFHSSNVLCVPNMKRNLISVSKFYQNNNFCRYFTFFLFFMKDHRTSVILVQRKTKDGVYEWHSHNLDKPPLVAFSSNTAFLSQWHSRLGHLSNKFLHYLDNTKVLSLPSYDLSSFSCNSCSCNRSHRSLFHESSLSSNAPLELRLF